MAANISELLYGTQHYERYSILIALFSLHSNSMHVCSLVAQSCPTLVTPWTVALQGPLSMQFSRQEYWNELPFPPPEDLPDPAFKPKCPASPALAGGFFTTEPPGKPNITSITFCWPKQDTRNEPKDKGLGNRFNIFLNRLIYLAVPGLSFGM